MTILLVLLACVLWLLTLVLPLVVWWPVRRTGWLRCVPWVVAWIVIKIPLNEAERIWGFSKLLNEASHYDPILVQSAGALLGTMAYSIVIYGTLANFLLVLIICANGAFLLSQMHFQGRVSGWLTRLYPHTWLLGLLMLVLTPLPKLHLIWVLGKLGLL